MLQLPFQQWSPSIHYAQSQTLQRQKLDKRRLYDCELLYISKGQAATTMNNHYYHLNEGDLIFFASGVYHQNEILSEQASFIGIHFSFLNNFDIITEDDMIVNEQDVQEHKFTVEITQSPFSKLSSDPVYKPTRACVQLMEELVHEFNNRAPGYELICKGYMLQILTLLLRNQFTKRLEDKSVHSTAIRKIMQDIQHNPAYRWTNKEFAKRMNVNEDYMAKLFKTFVGMKPSVYIGTTRHHMARQLLRESNLSIEVIGEKVGYDDAHYFSRIFRKYEGISPSEYRKLSRIL
jgi:YesN/AraC family two-component response regulator